MKPSVRRFHNGHHHSPFSVSVLFGRRPPPSEDACILIFIDRPSRRASHSLTPWACSILLRDSLPFECLLVLHIQMPWGPAPFTVGTSGTTEAPPDIHEISRVYSCQGDRSHRSLRSWACACSIGALPVETKRRLESFQPRRLCKASRLCASNGGQS